MTTYLIIGAIIAFASFMFDTLAGIKFRPLNSLAVMLLWPLVLLILIISLF